MGEKNLFLFVFCLVFLCLSVPFYHVVFESSPQIAMTGIVDNNSGALNPESVAYQPGAVGESFGIGLYDAPVHTPDHSLHYSKELSENEPFNGYLFISNQLAENNSFLIFCLVDYNQTSFSCDGSEKGVLHKVSLNPFEERFVKFSIDPLEKGVHDFEIFILLKTDQHSLNKSFRLSTDFSYLGSKRMNLFVFDDKLPEVQYTDFSLLSASNCGSDYPINDGIILTKEPCSSKGWFTEDVRSGEVLHYWINLAADKEYPVSFAVITLLDYIQVPLRTDMKEKCWFGSLSAGEKISVPASIVVPSEEGVHELMSVYIPLPYQRFETSPGVPTQFNQWTWSEPSIRIGLNVSAV